MCLILFAWRRHSRYPLVVAANRDEFYVRPTAPLGFWPEAPDVLAGRDLIAGGTWMGVTRAGRFAAITNYRDPAAFRPDAPSRGALVGDYLRGEDSPETYLERVAGDQRPYNGFNLLVGDDKQLWWYSNRNGPPRPLAPGLYGLSNHLLDTPWPKVERGKAALAAALEQREFPMDQLLAILDDRRRPPDEALPDTGVGLERERMLSPVFIESPDYGTCSSTVLLWGQRRVRMVERQASGQRRSFELELDMHRAERPGNGRPVRQEWQ